MRKNIAGVIVVICAMLFGMTGSVSAASVTPVLNKSMNIKCESLGYAHGSDHYTASGTYTLDNGVDTVTIVTTSSGLASWSSTLSMDAVIVKGGNQGSNVYIYNPEAYGDTNLTTPNNPNEAPAGLSHVEFCYDYEVQVNKTARTSYTRDWSWTINKTVDKTSLMLASGETYNLGYHVTVGAHSTDSNYGVNGTITVRNPDPTNAAMITSITDQISGLTSTTPVSCGVTFPYALGGGQTLACTYTQSLPDKTARVNTATATTTGVVGSGSAMADVTFGNPTTENDECATITDTLAALSPGQLCAGVATLPHTYNYTVPVMYTECGDHALTNTAQFVTNDTHVSGSSSQTVTVTVPCVLGCTLTQGYWKTHSSFGPAPYDDTWLHVGGASAMFMSSGQTWYQVFWTPPKGNAYYTLAHQYMASELNRYNNASMSPTVLATLSAAKTWLSNHTPTSVLSKAERTQVLLWASILDIYNNGLLGTPHCSE